MNTNNDNKSTSPYRKFAVVKKINKMKSLLRDWYGEKEAKAQTLDYMPKCLHVKEIVKRILSDLSHEDGLLLEKLQTAWPKLVGIEISNNSKPVSLKNEILVIEARNSVWLSELKNFYSHKIEEKVKSICGDSVKRVFFSPAGK